MSCSQTKASGETCAEPVAAAVRGVADSAY